MTQNRHRACGPLAGHLERTLPGRIAGSRCELGKRGSAADPRAVYVDRIAYGVLPQGAVAAAWAGA